MLSAKDISAIADYCKATLDLANAKLPDEYYYHSLPHCVVDAVFSIGVLYTTTKNTVHRFCDYYELPIYSRPRLPRSEQISINRFLELIYDLTPDVLAEIVFHNRQRTSPVNGILKAQAVKMWAVVLMNHGVNYLQDVVKIIEDEDFEKEIARIPGQRSGLSTRYFYMLSGSDNFIKPDRMIRRFLASVSDSKFTIQETHDVIMSTHKVLNKEFPLLTPRLLDYQIWSYQRSRRP